MDDYIENLDKPYFRAYLCNGDIVEQDDDRPGCSPASAWERLALKGERIEKMELWYRGCPRIEIPKSDRYFFCKRIRFDFGAGGPSHYYCVGNVYGDKIAVSVYSIPDLILRESEEMNVGDNLRFII